MAKINKNQACNIAIAIQPLIKEYINSNREAYELFLQERKKGNQR